MKFLLISMLLLSATFGLSQVGIGTDSPNENAILEMVSTTKGVLIPRIELTSVTSESPMSAHVAGMLVYNTATAGASPNDVSPGFYYNDGAKWIRIASAAGIDLTNDAWIDDNTNTQVKLGTLSDGTTTRPDAAAFVAKDNGNVGIGLTNPAGLLDVKGKIYQNNVQTIYNAGAIGTPNYAGSLFLGNGGGALTNAAIRNTGVGMNALNANTNGTNNTAIGFNAMAVTTTGIFNTATGSGALAANTQGARNTAGGAFALAGNTLGTDNTAFGIYALQANTTGNFNVGIGVRALTSGTGTSNGVAVGFESQANVLIPAALLTNNNTSVGYQSLKGSGTPANNIGNNNTAIGYQAMTAYTTGNYNVAVGFNAMLGTIDGVLNTAVGSNALEKNTSGSYNTITGRYALGNSTTSSYNTAFGYNAGFDLTTSASGINTFIGYNTGRGITTGSYNTVLGANVTGLDAALSNNIILADGQGNQRIRVLSDGKTGIGTLTPQKQLHVNGALQITNELNVGGNANTAGSAGTADQILVSNGAGAAPSWSDISEVADATEDAWVDDNTNAQILLGTLSDGTTVRPSGTEFIVKDDGKVGIGTSNPVWLLDVQGTSAIGHFKRFTGTSDYSVAPAMLFTRSRGTVAVESNIQANDFLGKVQFRGRTGGADADYGLMAYVANSTTAGDGRFGFFRGNGIVGSEVVSINTTSGGTASTLTVNGSLATNIRSVTGALTATDSYVIATGNITLPAANTCQGREYHIKNAGAVKTISTYINLSGGSVTALAANSVLNLVSDGTSWQQF